MRINITYKTMPGTLHLEETICDLSHILFDCPSLSTNVISY
jgi:hypothetical protein